MSRVYSKAFYANSSLNSGSPVNVYVVPAAETAVLRAFSWNWGTNIADGAVFIRRQFDGAVIFSSFEKGGFGGGAKYIDLRQVVEWPDSIQMQTFGGWTFGVYLSGYLLSA